MLRLLGAAGLCGGIPSFASESSGQCNSPSDHRAWVEECLKRMLTIQPGMTRNQLVEVFTTEGGLSNAKQRTFVSRDCAYFKITAEFRRADESSPEGKQTDWLQELEDDVITRVSGPYLQFSIMD